MEPNTKMQGKDYITCGILSLMNLVGMILSSVMNISGYTTILYGAAASFFVGILFVIVCCKVPKFGAILVFTIVPCIYFFTSGLIEGITGAVGALLLAFAAELILKNKRDSMKRITAAAIVYTLYMSVMGSAESFLFTDYYCDAALAHGINETVVSQMRDMYSVKPLWLVVIVSTALLTFAGTYVGKLIMRKHLKKAGII